MVRAPLAAALAGAFLVLLVNNGPQSKKAPVEIDMSDFRTDSVSVLSSQQEVKHSGVETEKNPLFPKLDVGKSDGSTEIHLSACQNDDAVIRNKVTLWTMLIGEKKDYITSAIKLVKSAKRHSRVDFDAMLLEIAEKPLRSELKEELRAAGWGVCTMSRIAPPDEEATLPYFRDQFTKFQLWRMKELNTIVYLDADTYVVGDITSLLTTNLGTKKIGVGRDFMHGRWAKGFNMGVFLIHPNIPDYELLMKYHRGELPLRYNKAWSEQAFLNSLWANDWHDIGFEFNANLELYRGLPSFWRSREGNIRIVHYTKKPWKGCMKSVVCFVDFSLYQKKS